MNSKNVILQLIERNWLSP